MNQREKLLAKAQSGKDLSYGEFQSLLRQNGWEYVRQRGSHAIWKKGNDALSIQAGKSGKANGYQIKQFLKLQEVQDG